MHPETYTFVLSLVTVQFSLHTHTHIYVCVYVRKIVLKMYKLYKRKIRVIKSRCVAILCIAANLFGLEHYFGPDRPALLSRVAVGALFASLCVFFF